MVPKAAGHTKRRAQWTRSSLARAMIEGTDGKWIYFDMVPGEYEIRDGEPDYTGRIVVINIIIYKIISKTNIFSIL